MAKKKKSKNSEKESFQYSVELTGLLLILIGIIGVGFGPVGNIIKKFAMFLLGNWWVLVLLLVLFLGTYMLFKRKMPKFFTSRLIGVYILIIVLLVWSHIPFIKECAKSTDIIKNTVDNYMSRIATISNNSQIGTTGQTSISIGGGIIGAFFAFIFSSCFGEMGTYIVLVVLALFGFIMLFEITLIDMFKKVFGIFKREHKEKAQNKNFNVDTLEYDDEEEEENKKEDKIIISSVEELKNNNLNNASAIETLPPTKENDVVISNYKLPPLSLLDDPQKPKKVNSTEFIKSNKDTLERVLKDFQIAGKVVEIHVGPAVTQYELTVPAGTKLSRISAINKEIALALAAKDVRIQAPIPGKSTIGIEIPNASVSPVKIKEILVKNQDGKINVALGKDIMGNARLADLSKMPHLLIAGSTGSGKSVCTNSIIASILMKYRPDECKLVLVDPKKVELSNYNGVPHLLIPVITDAKKASLALQKVVAEMERRYDIFSETGVKNIESYNNYIVKENQKHPENLQKKMHYLVVIIDELADLMLVAAKDVEDSIMRITQMARAAGIHLIVATQRPSTDVITGVVKANIPSRIAFAVASNIDSRTILDMSGAEKLLGKGDMLYLPMGENVPVRIQGCFISDDEIRRVIEYVCKEQTASYDESMNLDTPVSSSSSSGVGSGSDGYDDPLYDEIVKFAIETGKISASLLQRRFRLGYNRAARIVDLLEERGIIGPQNGSKPREVLVKLENKESEE
jgi:S-DNA-T family DNA segregation ATPase FtsK/SpoIIIE